MNFNHIKKHEGPDMLIDSKIDDSILSSFISLFTELHDINMVTRRCKSLGLEMTNIDNEVLVLTSKNNKLPLVIKLSVIEGDSVILCSAENIDIIRDVIKPYTNIECVAVEHEPEVVVVETPPPAPIEIPEVFKAPRKRKPARPVLET